jgi:hypothetical protein
VGGCSCCGDGPEDGDCGGGEVEHCGGVCVDGLDFGEEQDQGGWNAMLLGSGGLAMLVQTT